ncbi:c-type cytochrome [Flagellimonas baculiformis]|uniref:c-type cytochrome n=1 Tax=Flagellimonas baculiformis TaxID=3067310 RepID=UPI00296E9BDC|nr:cytochrome c [Muricauda sp. D6]
MLTFLMTLLALQATRAQTQWEAPASADNLNNPLKNDATAAESGKRTFRMLCVICHGAKGKGDGMGGAGLTPKPTDLTSTEVQSQSDGALFWKLTNGKPPMASYETALPENKRWELINYIRTLNK